MSKYIVDWNEYARIARQAAAEGMVLLKNDQQTLPFQRDEMVSVFGRIQLNYYKSGTGSGGAVRTRYVTNILDSLKESGVVQVNEELVSVYKEWVKENPFQIGQGWGLEPWSQEEMPLTKEMVDQAANKSDAAVIVIGRTAGEDRDNTKSAGSYYLTDLEKDMMEKVCSSFERVVVVLNVGNIIDMRWVDTYKPTAVLYAWQGGMEGGNAIADILTGKVNPSGKLSDTIAYEIEDYPSTKNFSEGLCDIYQEDIYVGYRYFETFAKDRVQYPFGYGLSYTKFAIELRQVQQNESDLTLEITVTNTGDYAGKEVVQVYVCKPQGKLGQPLRQLVAYEKTKLLEPGNHQVITIQLTKAQFASYDDSGITGYPYAFVLEAGNYDLYVGNDVGSAKKVASMTQKQIEVVKQCVQAAAPVEVYQRIRPEFQSGNMEAATKTYEDVPVRSYDYSKRIVQRLPECLPYKGDFGYRLEDVYDKKVSIEEFLSQFTEEELSHIVMGEGMSSPKVTPGTASAYGGVTDRLLHFGIPVACCSDGPSGIRMDCGTYAFSLPNGTCLACTFNVSLNEQLYEKEGQELRKNRVDTLLGPGMNIHRHPLNGRNFEYFSEDPYLTGTIGAAQVRGMNKWDVTGTIKHFAGNNRETNRHNMNSVISERALREIYLKGFEIAVKEGNAISIMTTYGALNGIWTAGNYDLNTVILRDEWGFDGVVMTDWWAQINEDNDTPNHTNLGAMVRSQNDLYMVVKNASTHQHNIMERINDGSLTRGELVRCASNICNNIMKLTVMDRFLDRITQEEKDDIHLQAVEDEVVFDVETIDVYNHPVIDTMNLDTRADSIHMFGITSSRKGTYKVTLKMRTDAKELSQIPLTVSVNCSILTIITLNGTKGEWVEEVIENVAIDESSYYLKLYFGQSGMQLGEIKFEYQGDLN